MTKVDYLEEEILKLTKENEELHMKLFLKAAADGAGRKIAESDLFIGMISKDAIHSAKIAVELGFSILLDKPIVIVAIDGQEVPANLKAVAKKIISVDTPGQTEKAMKDFFESDEYKMIVDFKEFE